MHCRFVIDSESYSLCGYRFRFLLGDYLCTAFGFKVSEDVAQKHDATHSDNRTLKSSLADGDDWLMGRFVGG